MRRWAEFSCCVSEITYKSPPELNRLPRLVRMQILNPKL